MKPTISVNSKEIMQRIVRNEFDKYPNYWQYKEREEIIETSIFHNMDEEFVQGMLNDL